MAYGHEIDSYDDIFEKNQIPTKLGVDETSIGALEITIIGDEPSSTYTFSVTIGFEPDF